MRSLLWKEWHEQRWKLAFGSLILGAFALIGLRARVVADEMLLEWICFLAVALLPVLASTGLIPSEREDGTFETLLSLPVAPGRIFTVKFWMGIVLTTGPLIVAAVVSLFLAGGRELSSGAIAALYGKSLAASVVLFLWMFALTVRLPTETRASLIAMAVLIMWLIVTLGLMQGSENVFFRDPMMQPLKPTLPSPLWTICPFFFLVPPRNVTGGLVGGAIAVQSVIAVLLVLWASRRFSAPTPAEGL